MTVITTVLPVFFMLGMGILAHRKNIVTEEQKAGVSAVIFNLLFPILIFHLILTAEVSISHLYVILYMIAAYVLALIIGKLLGKFTGEKYAHFSNFLLPVHEGGSVALPLYLSLVGTSSNTVIFDIAGMTTTFVIFPVLLERLTSESSDPKQLVRNIFTNSFVIAVIAGLALNLSGFHAFFASTPAYEAYTAAVTMAISPITAMILFTIGYDLKIEKDMIRPLAKLIAVKTVYYALILAGMALLFKDLMSDRKFMIAALIYLMSPTGFIVPTLITPLYRSSEDSAFASAFTSLYIVVTLIVYIAAVLFIA